MKRFLINYVLLFPYFIVLKIRHYLYDSGFLKSKKFDLPVISIGNIEIGGTGKTPHTEYLIKKLMPTERVAVLSRGYGRKSKGFHFVRIDSTVKEVGDEPLQMKRKFVDVIVAVCEKRVKGVEIMLSLPPESRPTVIILDDAFQHRKISPSTNILLVDYNHMLEEQILFPLGRLRDLPEQKKRADIVIVTKCPAEISPEERFVREQHLKLSNNQKLAFSTINYGEPKALFEGADRRYIYSKYAILITAVANPKPLQYQLVSDYKLVERLNFRDHHNFTKRDVEKINKKAAKWPKAVLFTTEKDAQRMMENNNFSALVRERIFYIPIEVEFVSENLNVV
ncbi:MAG TPA: tetraacyldisaccharide 4'-kinase [Bacteroidales bacterium]|jgi:tetraacyldisaccharide 4'-kinase|nr:tetraacyldisaccharide 4'-kinase [Bacteroidales bacterium]HRR48832.1 tetraacyldisaccharide 4'-kinase [Bacteroidales bacterium]HRT33407.1 tetraacyldisaccharide 4'-kinase [Bacteroidales bacterium]HRT83880.1 tetraacyldisaccharide 4'-kinase [Bacteroidales bacterium]